MATRTIGIILDGGTGRIATQQHLERSLLPIRRQGGLPLANGDRLMPDPVLLGRSAEKTKAHAESLDGLKWSTDPNACLADAANVIYFDASVSAGRVARAKRAIAAGKHVYLEKPVAATLEEALDLARAAKSAGLKSGVVQDKLGLPGFAKMLKLKQAGFFGEIYSARLDFGWWVFDGDLYPAQRPSWNYKKAEGGGLVLDMFPHWRYITESIIGPMTAVSARIATRQKRRIDEAGKPYDVDVEDEVFATFEHGGGILTHVTSSWATRIRRDGMVTFQVDGSKGSAVCGLYDCMVQPLATTPKPHWSLDGPTGVVYDEQWAAVPDVEPMRNGYRAGWEMFLREVAGEKPTTAPLLAGAKHVQLAEACHKSHRERRWIDLPELTV